MGQSFVYILYSDSLKKYYIGFTILKPEERLERHLFHYYDQKKKFTGQASDWIIFCQITCKDADQARKIEAHIKKMKSKAFIENLAKYPEITERLLSKYS
jgi:putative endonuclease